MRVAIIGAGGVGAYYGARFQAVGDEVCLVARGAHLAAMQARGLRVEHPDFRFDAPVDAIDLDTFVAERTPDAFDLLILAAKSAATGDIAARLKPWLEGGRPPLLSVQNGVDNEPVLAAALGGDRVLGGFAIRIGGHLEAPGVVTAKGEARIVAGPWPNGDPSTRPMLTELAQSCARAGLPIDLEADVRRALWRKLVLNNGVNPLSALTGMDTRTLTRDPSFAPLVRTLMEEAAAAAAADEVSLGADDVEAMFRLIHDFEAIKTSMLVDREHGRHLEIDALSGAVVRRMGRLGRPAPASAMVLALLGMADPPFPPARFAAPSDGD